MQMMTFGCFDQMKTHSRFNKSAVRMAMPEVPESIFIDGLKTLLNIRKGLGKIRKRKLFIY